MRFEDIITIENIYKAWNDFSTGKRNKKDVQLFEAHLEDELISLQNDLVQGVYVHNKYERFIVREPKQRIIHKAVVRDRIVHRLIYNSLLPEFHRRWLGCSYSCRPGFGQHKSIIAVRNGLRKMTQNWSRECWTLKVDVRKFFDSIDHEILYSLLERRVVDSGLRKLIHQVIGSFSTARHCGLPIGNLTSQLFANVYLHELDWYVKQRGKCQWYFRYADDMIFLCESKQEATARLKSIIGFLEAKLHLQLHPKKVILRPSHWGTDWLGHVILPGHEVLRPATRHRMFRNVEKCASNSDRARVRSSLASYHGLLIGTARRSVDSELLQNIAFMRGDDTMMVIV